AHRQLRRTLENKRFWRLVACITFLTLSKKTSRKPMCLQRLVLKSLSRGARPRCLHASLGRNLKIHLLLSPLSGRWSSCLSSRKRSPEGILHEVGGSTDHTRPIRTGRDTETGSRPPRHGLRAIVRADVGSSERAVS